MIHKKMKNRPSSGGTLAYIYRGKGHDHQIENLRHIHANMFSGDPIQRDPEGVVTGIDLEEMEQEFEFASSKNLRAKQKFSHYIISLKPGEKLTDEQWVEVAKDYMRSMGYRLSSKWTVAIHEEKSAQHAHILACRVVQRSVNKCSLVSDKNDFSKGMACMRRLEKRFKLESTPSPHETWGKNVPKQDFQSGLRALKKKKKPEPSWHQRLLAKMAIAVEESRGQSFEDFVETCKALGVGVMLTLNDKNFPTGISYSFEDKSIAGYHLKSSRLTFSRLTGMQYDDGEGQMIKLKGHNEGIVYEQVTDVPEGIAKRAERAAIDRPDAHQPAPAPAQEASAGEARQSEELSAKSGVGDFLKNRMKASEPEVTVVPKQSQKPVEMTAKEKRLEAIKRANAISNLGQPGDTI